jgi:hypothetical protein
VSAQFACSPRWLCCRGCAPASSERFQLKKFRLLKKTNATLVVLVIRAASAARLAAGPRWLGGACHVHQSFICLDLRFGCVRVCACARVWVRACVCVCTRVSVQFVCMCSFCARFFCKACAPGIVSRTAIQVA